MKILAIIGSPRKKNTLDIAKTIIDRFSIYEKVNFEIVSLTDYKLDYCKSCWICIKNHESKCIIKDDYPILKEKMIKSDLIILGSPVYACNISGITKNFIDRSFHLFFRPEFTDKYAIALSTARVDGLKTVLNYLEFTIKEWGFKCPGKIGVLMTKFTDDAKYKLKLYKKIDNIYKNYINRHKIVTLKDLVLFYHQKNKIIKNKNYWIYNYNYWNKNGWLTKDYFYDLKINPFKKLLARFIKLSLSKN